MAELVVKYRLDADGLTVNDLVTERDFLAQRLRVPEHLLQVLSWGHGSVVITYWILRDLLPLAELALCREDVRAELTQHGVEAVYLDNHLSEQLDPVRSRIQSMIVTSWCNYGICIPPSMQNDRSLQTVHRKGDAELMHASVFCD